jgi:predicted RNase H-like nuclease (RuvC/YqgF family)
MSPKKEKKRLQGLVDAVSAILGDDQEAKKLRKVKALERFIGKLENKERDLDKELSKDSLKEKVAREKSRQVETLGKQIKKARKILADMKK